MHIDAADAVIGVIGGNIAGKRAGADISRLVGVRGIQTVAEVVVQETLNGFSISV